MRKFRRLGCIVRYIHVNQILLRIPDCQKWKRSSAVVQADIYDNDIFITRIKTAESLIILVVLLLLEAVWQPCRSIVRQRLLRRGIQEAIYDAVL